MTVLVIDYGMSNLGSIRRALEECGADVCVSDDPKDLKQASKIILPGVGAYADGMANLDAGGWLPAIHDAAVVDTIPMLGICLGMQLLASTGYENGKNAGLGLIPGEVIKFNNSGSNERIPHVGWNEVNQVGDNLLFTNIEDGSDFYFVHSYHFIATNSDHIAAMTPYCGGFASVVNKENVYGVQFHPEKSGRPGFQVLKNFLDI